MKLVGLIKRALIETYSQVLIGKHLSDAIREVKENQVAMKLNGTH
jgi:hypothetical protein